MTAQARRRANASSCGGAFARRGRGLFVVDGVFRSLGPGRADLGSRSRGRFAVGGARVSAVSKATRRATSLHELRERGHLFQIARAERISELAELLTERLGAAL